MNRSRSLIIDTKPFCLYTIGSLNQDYISRVSRVKSFSIQEYRELLALIEKSQKIYTNSNVLSEASHFFFEESSFRPAKLYRQAIIKQWFRWFGRSSDVSEKSTKLIDYKSMSNEIIKFGLTDISLLQLAINTKSSFVTSDRILAGKSSSMGITTFTLIESQGLLKYDS